jgi:hypothetical protein
LPMVEGFEGGPGDREGSFLLRMTAREEGPFALFDRWREAIERAGVRVENLHEGAERAATLVVGSERYFVAVRPAGELRLQRASARAVQLTGACAPIPDDSWSSIVTRWGSTSRRYRYGFAVSWTQDLDRDGVPDAVVPLTNARDPQHTCPAGIEWDVYVARGGCGHLVGRVQGRIERTGAARAGLDEIETDVDVMGPREPIEHVRYAFDGAAYREVERSADEARCEVHPADCEDLPHTTCELRGHPRVPSVPDSDEIGQRLGDAARAAQAGCLEPAARVERCDVHPTFSPDGSIRRVRVDDCPRRRACVEPLFRAIRVTPWVGDPPLQSISFQIPAP